MRIRFLALAAFACLCVLPTAASATHVQCGDVLTQQTVLDSDLICPDPATVGLVIGGDDFTVWLGGHTIQGPGVDVAAGDGVGDDGTVHSGVTIRGGTITGFEDGVDLDVTGSATKGLTVSAGGVGIAMRGNDNTIFNNTVDMTNDAGVTGFSGIEAVGDNAYVWGNTVNGSAAAGPDDGIVVNGDNPVILVNSVTGCGFDGVIATGYTTGLVALNDVTGCDIGIAPSGTGLKLQSNTASGNCIGIFVDDPAALVRWNTANDNCTEGIVIGQAGASLKKNTANGNVDIGIDAVVGTIDLGGNTASGNATDCLGVVCTLPVP
jgi:hypothetical protein